MKSIRLPGTSARVTPLTAAEIATMILDRNSRDRGPLVLANLNLHGLYLYATDPTFRNYCNTADFVIIDGWPILALARLGDASVTRRHRVGSTDWLQVLLARSAEASLSVVAVGATPDVAAKAKQSVEAAFPWVRWAAYDGYTDWSRQGTSDASSAGLKSDMAAADLVIVGMGMPKQEAWIADNLHLTSRALIANVGGCIDYIGGAQYLAPRWLGPIGLEWAYRLGRSPRRLWRRYLIEPLLLLSLLVKRSTSRAISCDRGRMS